MNCKFYLILTLLAVVILDAKAQGGCNEPKLMVSDTVRLFNISVSLVKNEKCTRDVQYALRKVSYSIGRGDKIVATEETTLLNALPPKIMAQVSPGSKLIVQVLEADRIIDGKTQSIPIGKWGTVVRVVY